MTTQTRLDAYLAAEGEILKAQEVRGGDRSFRRTELVAVQQMISQLQRQIAREEASSAEGSGGVKYSLANLNRAET
jgi:hypothetical protein